MHQDVERLYLWTHALRTLTAQWSFFHCGDNVLLKEIRWPKKGGGLLARGGRAKTGVSRCMIRVQIDHSISPESDVDFSVKK